MASYALTCCSTADLSKEHFESRNIPYICFHYFLNGVEHPDDLGQTLPFDRFYKAMQDGAETRTARLQFRQDSYTILPEFRNNRAELDTVSNSILLVKRNGDVEITGIYITGYASPEGSEAHNLVLSENRAKALAGYIRRHDGIAPELLHVEWRGEDWDGFVEALDDYPQLLGLDRIRELIAKYPGNRDYCELAFRRLEPPAIYRRLLNEVYPPLRRNEYRIEYNVRNFDLEEARRMIGERPDLLSLEEMYKVAGSYEKGSAGYERAMETAARCYPDRPAVLNDRALAALGRGDAAAAIGMLEGCGLSEKHPSLLNTLGVAYARKPIQGTVLGIDIETTGRAPERGYIINVGWEIMDLTSDAIPHDAEAHYCGLPDIYRGEDVPLSNIHHITWDDIDGKKPFRENKELQKQLLKLMKKYPYMAHNAAFDIGFITAAAKRSGLTDKICRALLPLLGAVFTRLRGKSAAIGAISMNITANMLGLGNAATPLGIAAMKELKAVSGCGSTASAEMVCFVVMNTASLQILPTTVAVLRMEAGAANPLDILPAVWTVSACSLLIGLFAAKLFYRSGAEK